MKKITICLGIFLFLTACTAGELTPQRRRLHNMGQEGICVENPDRCVSGTNIPW